MNHKFKLRFPKKEINYWASRYEYKNEDVMCDEIAPKIQKQKYLTKDDFIYLCRWKSPRIRPQANKNDYALIREITKIALTTPHPKLSIEVLLILKGVSWPVASVILHFGKKNKYPILDYRALWSLGVDRPIMYTFDIWNAYSRYCQKVAKESKVDMRTLDRALWQYSKENQ
ncbi:MAG TPA: hypothetical protein VLH59_07975 [Ignavibacteriaceae bacterium]|nr:hypothetical protein [Ignavibacteriaceae bacterium]